jgi:4-hydroxy-2-oxoglutarate aldolase
MKNKLKGVMPPVPTLFENDKIAVDRFRSHLQRLDEAGLSGFVILGSNGEASLLTEAEKLALLRAARTEISQEKLMVVGTGMESTKATYEFTRKAADLGADAALVLTPGFYRPGNTGLQRHYETVADDSPIPLLLYNVPKFTGMNISIDLVGKLANHQNIVGMKDSAGDIGQLAALREQTPADFRLFIGADKTFLAGLAQGMDGAILALANVAPRECVALFEAVQNGNWTLAQKLAAQLAPVGRTVVGKYGVPGLKAALDTQGHFGGDLRLPLIALDNTARQEIREVLQNAELLG